MSIVYTAPRGRVLGPVSSSGDDWYAVERDGEGNVYVVHAAGEHRVPLPPGIDPSVIDMPIDITSSPLQVCGNVQLPDGRMGYRCQFDGSQWGVETFRTGTIGGQADRPIACLGFARRGGLVLDPGITRPVAFSALGVTRDGTIWGTTELGPAIARADQTCQTVPGYADTPLDELFTVRGYDDASRSFVLSDDDSASIVPLDGSLFTVLGTIDGVTMVASGIVAGWMQPSAASPLTVAALHRLGSVAPGVTSHVQAWTHIDRDGGKYVVGRSVHSRQWSVYRAE